MHYVYLLYSRKASKFYIGETKDLRRRLSQHNAGESFSTKSGRPWEVVYYEAYMSKQAAQTREKRLKQYGKGLAQLKNRIGLDEWLKGAGE